VNIDKEAQRAYRTAWSQHGAIAGYLVFAFFCNGRKQAVLMASEDDSRLPTRANTLSLFKLVDETYCTAGRRP
jgi:hypothetical protein